MDQEAISFGSPGALQGGNCDHFVSGDSPNYTPVKIALKQLYDLKAAKIHSLPSHGILQLRIGHLGSAEGQSK